MCFPAESLPLGRGPSEAPCFLLPLQLSLAKACANGNQLGLEAKASSEIVSQLFQASRAVSKQRVFSVQKGLNDTMR